MRGAVLLALTLIGPLGGCTAGSEPVGETVPVEARLQGLLDSTFEASGGVPGAMLRVDAGARGVRWEAALGLADPDTQTELKPLHPFRIASITKTYVAAAVLRLEEEGGVALDDAIEGYLPASTVRTLRGGGYDPGAITVQMLMQHTSGLADYATTDAFLEQVLSAPGRRWTREGQLRIAMDLGEPVGSPGAQFRYSDTGYILLGELLERVTAVPLHQALRQLLAFEALGLEGTWLESAEPAPPGLPGRVHQHLDSLDTYAFNPSFDLFGGGGLVSTLGDLSVFFRELFTGGVFRESGTLARMTAVTPESLHATEGGYGMGLARVRYDGVDCFGHGGFWGALVRYCPGPDLSVVGVVTSTTGRAMLDALVRESIAMVSEPGDGGRGG